MKPPPETRILASTRHTRRLLVVDADANTRALYPEICAQIGWDVVEASDGRDALEKALTRAPTVIITELYLPFVDGFALCDILRRDHATADVPILVVTTEGRAPVVARARTAGANNVLVKPIPVETVMQAVERLVPDSRDGHHHHATKATADGQPRDPPLPLQRRIRSRLVNSFVRFTTTTPPVPPPALPCPACGHSLTYECSHVGGVSERHPEQWDIYVCSVACGTFEYRQRTRRLRPTQRSA